MADKNPDKEGLTGETPENGISSEANPLTAGELNGEDNKNIPTDEEGVTQEGAEVPEVAPAGKTKNFIVLGAIVLIGLLVIISILSKSKPKPQANQETAQAVDTGVPVVPQDVPSPVAPPAPPLVEPPLPPPSVNEGGVSGESAPPPGQLPPLPTPTGSQTVETQPPIAAPVADDKDKAARLKAGMMVTSGTENGGAGGAGGVNPNEAKRKITKGTPVDISEAETIGDTTNMVAQGKMIDAVLETALNTDFPGVLRAEVSRDVYAESGRKVLIPKGSRLIGIYNADIKAGQARVYIIWNRIIRPDGINIELDSPGTDTLGRTGIPGQADEHYLEIIGNSLLFSAIDFGFVAAAASATGAQGTTTTTSQGGVTTTSQSPQSQALSQEIINFGSTVHGLGNELINIKPTITVDQGTPIKVFVNRDLWFNTDKQNSADRMFK